MDLTNEIVEKHGFKRINNSTWRKGNWTLQNGWTSDGVTIYDRIFNTKKAFRLCIDGRYSQMITSAELLAELVRGREVDAGISKCNKHIVNDSVCHFTPCLDQYKGKCLNGTYWKDCGHRQTER